MDNMKKRRIKKYIFWICIVALVAVLTVLPLLANSEAEASGPQASILSGTAEIRDIETVLLGGGTLAAQEAEAITVPASVKLVRFLVSNGDVVSAGDAIAEVDRVSVMTAIAEVQETMDDLAEQIEEAAEDTVSESVTAKAGGTVKIIYAEEGDSVQEVMLENGALAVLSLDGLMAVKLERDSDVAAGDSVVVTLSDETELTGRVESNLSGEIVITVEDDGYAVGQQVFVTTEDGERLGKGELYIHSPWNATAYSGTVGDIKVTTEKSVSAGKTLMALEDTGYTAQYQQLSSQRREYEELMLELFELYQTTRLTAPCDGVVSGIDENSAQLLSADGQTWTLSLLTNAPNGDDESQYTNFVGQVRAAGIDGLVMAMNPMDLQITDYKNLTTVPVEPETMTEEVIYSDDAPIYELMDDQWVQLDGLQIMAGDILLFACDAEGNFVWVIRVPQEKEEIPEMPPEETLPEPSEPTEPSEPEATEPTVPSDNQQVMPSIPSEMQQPIGSAMSGMMGGFYQGGVTEEETFTLYGLETVTVASVTAQNEMTVEIAVDELDIGSVALGQAVTVTVDALEHAEFPGVITGIGNEGAGNGGNSKFTVEVTLERRGNMLAGMNAAVSLTLDTLSDVLTIPVAALVENGTETIVYTGSDEDGNLTAPVPVTLGVSDGEYVQVLSGLEAGSAICYAYYDTLEISSSVESGGFGMFG